MNNLSIVLATRSGVIHFINLANVLAYLNNNAQNMETSLYVMGDEKELFDPFFLFSFQFSPKNSVHFKDWLELATILQLQLQKCRCISIQPQPVFQKDTPVCLRKVIVHRHVFPIRSMKKALPKY